MRKLIVCMALALFCMVANATVSEQEALLQDIRRSQANNANVEQESLFISNVAEQKQMLEAARAALKKETSLNVELKTQLATNLTELANLESALSEKVGSLADLFGVARQVAGDLKAELSKSIISAQFPHRTQALAEIANNKALPNMEQLEKLWFLLQQEMIESGKVARYQGDVLSATGELGQATVLRVGTFNATADGRYLHYLPETGKLSELPRQPDGKFLTMAKNLTNATTGRMDFAIDPTRGNLLDMLIQKPSFIERVQQGGLIGYITLSLGFAGFAYGVFRLLMLYGIGKKMFAQLASTANHTDNPLGRLFIVAEKSNGDSNNLELLLDEAITREVPALEDGLPLIKLIAAIAPLLGLLGTVTGMIITFQSISLFGSGDPKLMAEGISQALVTTVIGLSVAIPLLFLHSLLAARSRVLVQILDEQTAGLISRRAGL